MIRKNAVFSACRTYRYSLSREWGTPEQPCVNFIGLNPSTADENFDDDTIRRCIKYAESWGYKGICMTNLFAYRATKAKKMLAYHAPVGALNDLVLVKAAKQARLVVACWGANGAHLSRDKTVIKMVANLYCLTLTKNGHPGHPLYLKKSLRPTFWQEASVIHRFSLKTKKH